MVSAQIAGTWTSWCWEQAKGSHEGWRSGKGACPRILRCDHRPVRAGQCPLFLPRSSSPPPSAGASFCRCTWLATSPRRCCWTPCSQPWGSSSPSGASPSRTYLSCGKEGAESSGGRDRGDLQSDMSAALAEYGEGRAAWTLGLTVLGCTSCRSGIPALCHCPAPRPRPLPQPEASL